MRARGLRLRSTPAERVLWKLLRDRRLGGAKFRRQAPVGPFFADFFGHEAMLVIEADGGHHPTPRDPARDEFLRACGYRVLRFRNDDVLSNPADLAQRIAEAIRAPSPSGRGG
jgi:very-short-patch-repair endonuclease